eukprot:gene6434-6501_t
MFPRIFRLIVTLGVVFVAAITALQALTYTLTQRELQARSDAVLKSEMARFGAVPGNQRIAVLNESARQSASGLNYFALENGQGALVAGNLHWHGAAPPDHPLELAAGAAAPVPLRVLVHALPDGQRIIVARDISQIAEIRQRLLWLSLAVGLGVLVSAAALAVALSLGPLRRVQMFRASAKRIAGGELAHRMPVSARRDELDLVATTINAMVEEIERLMEQVKGATDAIAHDLRAPLARLRMKLAAQGGAPDALGELDAVLTRFDALLRIAEMEAAGRRAGFAPIDPMVLLTTTAEMYEPLAEERGIEISLSGAYGHMIIGDEALLVEALGNLIDNAIKFGPEGGRVDLALAREETDLVLAIADNGPGIAKSEREAVLRRFYRGAASRQAPGSGLGLNLVAAIVHLHGFGLELGDAAPGLLVRIRAGSAPT